MTTPAFLSRCGSNDDSQRCEYPWAEFDVPRILRDTTDEIRAWFDAGKLAYRQPRERVDWGHEIDVTFIPHDFWVPHGFRWENGEKISTGVCAKGMADQNYYEIFVSTRVRSYIPSLIRWETGNVWLGRTGRTDWMDRWNLMRPDAGWTPQPKRRSVGR